MTRYPVGQMATKRLLVSGASGTLGGPLTERAEAAGWDVTGTYFSRPDRIRAGTPVQIDLRDEAAVRALAHESQPDVIINAAVTERSGPGYEDAIRLSGQHLAHAAREVGARLIALSTDLVFDGAQDVYTEDSPAQPMANSVYGQAKVDYEQDVRVIYPSTLVVRTSLIYDFDRDNAQVGWMLRALERGESLTLYTDQFRCPIWAVNLADALLELAVRDESGLLHVVGPALVSRNKLGCALLAALGIDPAAHVTPALAPDTHPRRLHLSVERAQALLSTPLLTLAEARASWEDG
ncbi:MAG: SDR family oxidoreductase [Chloroflexi bacterium]|nr:SDR family oxidoreductase [Chloroflexota bacterium]